MYKDIDQKDPASIWSHPAFLGAALVIVFLCVIFGRFYLKPLLAPVPEQPTWIATYENTNMPDWCARGYINGDPCDIVEAPYKGGHLYQIWYDNTVFWHYESNYELPTVTLFTNGDWTIMVESTDFKGGNNYATNR